MKANAISGKMNLNQAEIEPLLMSRKIAVNVRLTQIYVTQNLGIQEVEISKIGEI